MGRALNDGVFWVIGHRGSPTVEVENTLPSFERALVADGANGLEFDLCVTRDSEVILWHDFSPLDGIARCRLWGLEPHVRYRPYAPSNRFCKPTNELTLAEFREHYGYRDKRWMGNRVDAQIPTLAQFMEWALRRRELAVVFFDVKIPSAHVALVPTLLEKIEVLVQRLRPRFQIVFESAHAPVLAELARLAPQYEHALDVEPPPGFVFAPDEHSAVRAAIKHRFGQATPARPRSSTFRPFATHRRIVEMDLALVRRHNERSPESSIKGVCPFTINEEREMATLIDLGVSAIQSDRPALLRRIALSLGRKIDGVSASWRQHGAERRDDRQIEGLSFEGEHDVHG